MAEGTGNYNTRAEWRDGRLSFLNGGGDTALSDVGAIQFGATATSALLQGGGTSTVPLTTASADKNFFGFWLSSSSATGTTRGQYIRLYLTGGAGGEAIRAYTTNSSNSPVDTVNGAHITLSHGASAGNVTGQASAARLTYAVPNRNLTGTNAAVQLDLWADGSNSNVTGNAAFIRASLGGDGTGVGKLDDTADVMRIDGVTVGAGNMVAQKSSAAVSHTARIRVNGTIYYLMLSDAQ